LWVGWGRTKGSRNNKAELLSKFRNLLARIDIQSGCNSEVYMNAREVLVGNLANLYSKLNEMDAIIERFYENLNKNMQEAADNEALRLLELERDETFQLARTFAMRLISLDRQLLGGA